MISRRTFVKVSALGGLLPLTTILVGKESSMHERIAAIIREYDAQGIHRTGTDVDHASAAWLADRIRALGVEPAIETFEFNRLNVRDARVVIGDLEIEGVPLYDTTYTGAAGVSGALGAVGSNADIGVAMTLPYAGSAGFAPVALARKENTHKAIVLVTDERLPDDGIATLNAESFQNPFGAPVLQVSNRHWEAIRLAAENNTPGRVIAHCEYVASTASNVEAYLEGRTRGYPPLVIMTPRSGWWTCASERGGGIAAFLEMMRAIKSAGNTRDVIFTANTGHELGHIGLDHFLESNKRLLTDAHLWIHLGANFAASVGGGVRLQYSDAQAQAEFVPHLKRTGIEPAQVTPPDTRPLGEARNVFDGGGRYISILGSNGLFHHPADTWPDAVDLDKTAAWVRAFSNLAVTVASTG